MEPVLLENCRFVLDHRGVEEHKDILLDGEGKISHEKDRSGEVLDCSRFLVTPGFVNAHTHIPMTLFRGYADDMELKPWLEEKIWPVERKLRKKHVYWGAMMGIVELLESGVVLFNDMYFLMGEVARAVEETGIKAALSTGLFESEEILWKEAERNFKIESPRVRWFVGPHAPYTCFGECLERARELAEEHGARIHIHAAETRREAYDMKRRTGMWVVEYLDSKGVLAGSVLAHAAWVTKGEIDLMARRGAFPVHCPVSNLKLASGVAPVPEMLERSIPVALGTDGPASNNSLSILQEAKVTALIHKGTRYRPTAVEAREVFRMITLNGYRALGFEGGEIKEGMPGDLVLFPLDQPSLRPLSPKRMLSHVIYALPKPDTVFVDGRKVVKGGRFLGDRERIFREFEKAREDLFKGYEE